MADTLQLGASPEEIAYKLFLNVAQAEQKALSNPHPAADRAWILKTYAQCLRTVRAPQNVNEFLGAQ